MMTTAAVADNSWVRWGRQWFRWRGVSPVPFFLLMFALAPEFHPGTAQTAALLGALLLAEGLRLWAVGYAGSATRTRGDSIPELVHAGPFRYVRNPLYIANIAQYTLTGLLFGFYSLSAAVFLYACVQYTFIVAFEEDRLEKTFGKPYTDYKAVVPRWLPSLAPAIASSGHRFHGAAAVRSEKSTLLLIGVVLLVWVAKRFLLA